MSEKFTTKQEINAFVELMEIRKEVRNMTRAAKTEGLNKFKHPSHIVVMTHVEANAILHTLIMEESIQEVFEFLYNHDKISYVAINELGKSVMSYEKNPQL